MPSADVTTWWDDRDLRRATEAWEAEVLDDAGDHLATAVRKLISTQGVPVSRRSVSPEPPRMESHDLINSWQYTVNAPGGYVDVYSTLDYSYYLEIGADATFGRIEARPYVSRAFISETAALAAILTQPMR